MMRGLEDKVLIVAAGGMGDGRPSLGGATARRLAAEGARVIVGDVDAASAERTVAAITDAGGTGVAHEFDAADGDSIAALVQRAVTEYGGLDGVHFNAMDMSAGTLGVDSEHDLLTLPLDVWQRSIDVGLTGFLLTCRHAIPHLIEGGGGGIVGTASGAVYAGEPVRVAYATTKTGMTAVARHVASRWGRDGIRCHTIAPGYIPGDPSAANEELSRRGRTNRGGRPDDIAGMVAFLLSDDGAWMNGHVYNVDGGTFMRA